VTRVDESFPGVVSAQSGPDTATTGLPGCLIRFSPASLSIPEFGIPTTTNLLLTNLVLLHPLSQEVSFPIVLRDISSKDWLLFEDTRDLSISIISDDSSHPG